MGRRRCLQSLIACALCLALVTQMSRAAGPGPRANQSRLEREVAALTAIYDFSLTPEQLTALQSICKNTAASAPVSTAPPAGDNYRQALRKLREALADGDGNKIDSLEAKVEQIRDSDKIDPDTDFPLTDAARSAAPSALALLSSGQIANYLATHSDDVPDATDTITDALDACRAHQGAEFNALRDEATEQVGLLMAGLDKSAAKPIEKSVSDLLENAHLLSDADFQAKHDDLVKQAKQITKGVDGVQALRFWLQRELADLLSNPSTPDAIALKKERGKS